MFGFTGAGAKYDDSKRRSHYAHYETKSESCHAHTHIHVGSITTHIYTAFGVKRPSNTKQEIKLVENDSFDYRNHKKYAIFKISFIIILH